MDKMLKVAKLFIAMSAFLLGMAHGQDGKDPRFFHNRVNAVLKSHLISYKKSQMLRREVGSY